MGGLRRAAVAAGFAGSTIATVVVGYWRMFTIFAPYDDEGWILASLRSFLDGHPLYSDVFTQYGPFYYELFGGFFKLFGLSATMNTGRLVTLALWAGSSLIAGLAVHRLTRQFSLGLAAQLVWFRLAEALIGEPMHPVGLVTVLLATTGYVLVATVPRRPAAGFTALGALAAALCLTKINVGGFVVLGLAFAAVLSFPLPRRARWCAVTAFVAVPLALMGPDLGAATTRTYAIVVVCSLLTIAVAGRRAAPAGPATAAVVPPLLLRAILVGLAVAAAIVVVILVVDSPIHDLIRVVVVQALHQRDAFSIPLELDRAAIPLAACSVVVALICTEKTAPRLPGGVGAVLRLGTGLAIWLSAAYLIGPDARPLLLPVLLVWVAALPPVQHADPLVGYARTALAASAAFQTLQAYPVAGTQVSIGSVLLVLAGAVCVHDGVRGIAAAAPGLHAQLLARWVGIAVAVGLSLNVLVERGSDAVNAYARNVALPFPSADRLHLPAGEVEGYQSIVSALRGECRHFVTYPGMYSFHEWSGIKPLTALNAADWMFLLDANEQRQVRARLRTAPQACVLRNRLLVAGWLRGRPLPAGPLIQYIDQNFTPIEAFGTYELLVKRDERRGSRSSSG